MIYKFWIYILCNEWMIIEYVFWYEWIKCKFLENVELKFIYVLFINFNVDIFI